MGSCVCVCVVMADPGSCHEEGGERSADGDELTGLFDRRARAGAAESFR